MLKRILVGAILIAFVGGLGWLDWHLERLGWPRLAVGPGGQAGPLRALPLTCLMLLLIAAGYLEYARMAAAVGIAVPKLVGTLGAMMVGTWPFWRQMTDTAGTELLAVMAVVVMGVFAAQVSGYRAADAIRRIGATLGGICYLGICSAVVLEIRMIFGVAALILFLVSVKFADIGAYFTGTAIGRHKIAPSLSPGKSWEGLIGGLALAAGAAVVFVALVEPLLAPHDSARLSLAAAAAFAVVVGLFGQGADMCESALKRDAGTKDAGQAVPGFGGVLDVIDSPLLAAPVALVLLAWLR